MPALVSPASQISFIIHPCTISFAWWSRRVSIQFSRSVRSLQIDSSRLTLVGLGLGIIMMVALILWFFLARITLFEISTSATFDQNRRVQATFSPEGLSRIQPGQAALVRLSAPGDQRPIAIPAMVYDTQKGKGQVELILLEDPFGQSGIPSQLSARAEVEVEYINPAMLVMRASGKFLNRSRLPVSPQNLQTNGAPAQP